LQREEAGHIHLVKKREKKKKKEKTMLLDNVILLLFSLHSGLREGTWICAINICV